jgi:hypothetical protein
MDDKINISIAQIYMWIKCALHQVYAYLISFLVQTMRSLQQLWYFLTVFILTHPVNFLSLWQCERKPENTKKTHDFRQSVETLFTCMIRFIYLFT